MYISATALCAVEWSLRFWTLGAGPGLTPQDPGSRIQGPALQGSRIQDPGFCPPGFWAPPPPQECFFRAAQGGYPGLPGIPRDCPRDFLIP